MIKKKSFFILPLFLLGTSATLANTLIETPIEREESNDPVAPQAYVDNPLIDEFQVDDQKNVSDELAIQKQEPKEKAPLLKKKEPDLSDKK